MAGRTFEEFLLEYMAEALGEKIAVLLTQDAISITIDDRQGLSEYHDEGTFFITCNFMQKEQADRALEKAAQAIAELPYAQPMVMRTRRIAQDVKPAKAPRKWQYMGAFLIRWHTEDEY